VKIGEYRGGDAAVFERADAVAALVVAVIVVYVSVRLGRRAADALLDRAPAGLADRLSQKVKDIDGILRVSRIRVRDAGSQIFVDLIVDVPRHLSFEDSHELTRKAEQAVRSVAPNADVVVHTNPIAESETILEVIQAVAARERVSAHNVNTHWTGRGMWIDLDLEIDPALSFELAHARATDLEAKLRSEFATEAASTPVAEINVHIEPRPEESAVGTPLEPAEADPYVERVTRISREFEQTGGCHDIELHRIDGKIYLCFHLLIHAGVPIAEVHGIAEEVENRLRREFPELGRVVIHTEPRPGDGG
jgi:divalent metal cation (Fe/Co/Zn/Cd) transporter